MKIIKLQFILKYIIESIIYTITFSIKIKIFIIKNRKFPLKIENLFVFVFCSVFIELRFLISF